jgi:hypothetical protein
MEYGQRHFNSYMVSFAIEMDLEMETETETELTNRLKHGCAKTRRDRLRNRMEVSNKMGLKVVNANWALRPFRM